jgi:hypothetical protein
MDNAWFSSALWVGLALIASVAQRWITVSIALIEIIVGAVAGNLVDLTMTPCLTPFYFLKAGSLARAEVLVGTAGAILLYLAVKMVTKFVGILPLTRSSGSTAEKGCIRPC